MMRDPNGLTLSFRWDHRTTVLEIRPKLFPFSVHRGPFLSVRFLCFWLRHDWNPIGVPLP